MIIHNFNSFYARIKDDLLIQNRPCNEEEHGCMTRCNHILKQLKIIELSGCFKKNILIGSAIVFF